MIHGGHDGTLVSLSIAIAVFASYTALDLGGHVRTAERELRGFWIAAAALAMGGGIWSMHFIGMMAFDLGLPVTYDPWLTALSLAIAVGATGAAFARVGRVDTRLQDVVLAGPLLGGAIAAMHYTGMAAMRFPGTLSFAPGPVLASIVIAASASTVALWLTFRQNRVWQKLLAAAVMGFAVAGMHYTGMSAARFSANGAAPGTAGSWAGGALGQQYLAILVAAATLLILFLGILASSIDQGRVQRRLHASEARFRAAAEAVGDIIWTTDRNGEMRGTQPDWEVLTGQSEAEYQGDGWKNAVHPEDVQPTLDAWRKAVAERGRFEFEHRVRNREGVFRLFSIRAVPLLDQQGGIREWVGVHKDVTEQREFERELKQARDTAEGANRAKSEFLANMSHELRTPLSAVIGYAEMLEEEAEEIGEESLLKDLGKIKSNAKHLLGLINDVLDLSKVEANKMDLTVEAIDVADFVRETAATVDSLVSRKSNDLVLDIASDVGGMSSDAVKLRQCLFNLLSNAAKFTENGRVTLSARREAGVSGEAIVFAVSDTGIGMSPDQVERLFQRFTQADESTTRRFGGTGLGLALSRAFAQLLGGDIEVESVEGTGTTFTMRLPAGPVPAEGAAPGEPVRAFEGDGEGEVVLVVDDEASQRELMTRFLERQRFSVRTASDGRSGLALARELKPRAILLDVMMPGMDGWSVLTALKADPDLAAIPVVMVSFAADAALGQSLGAVESIPKPVDWAQLKDVMDQFRAAEGQVLVVDDDAEIRGQLRTVLERYGWTVVEAGNGVEALETIRHGAPRVILLDLTMPVMDGFAFLRRLREMPGCRDIPVVVLSARDITVDERAALAGAERVLRKGDTSLKDLAIGLRRIEARPNEAGAGRPA